MDLVSQGSFDRLLLSADANCRPLGRPGVKGHPLSDVFEDMLPDLRTDGLTETQVKAVFQDHQAESLSMTKERPR